MALGDLRGWLHEVEDCGELREIHGAHWDREIGAISELNLKAARPLALLFNRIPDYPNGYRVLTSANAAPSRLGLSLRLGGDLTTEGLIRALPERLASWRGEARKFPVEWVNDGPVAEYVQEGSAVDLLRFPSPRWHEGDAGRYLGTSCMVLTRDPESDWINGASYRMQVHGPCELGLYILTEVVGPVDRAGRGGEAAGGGPERHPP